MRVFLLKYFDLSERVGILVVGNLKTDTEMNQTNIKTRTRQYNEAVTVAMLDRQETLNPAELNLLTYSGPKDTCQGLETGRLGNMAGGFHFEFQGVKWYGTEHLYLCGEWSTDDAQSVEIQEYIRRMPSGVYAKRCSKAKYRNLVRSDFPEFRLQWMLWCVWQKCLRNQDFANLLRSMPEDGVIVEVVKNDPVWAAYPDEKGVIRGGNAMGKILTICRRCLVDGTEPDIDRELLNKARIYLLGEMMEFGFASATQNLTLFVE